jgi:hypothetical protein
MIGLRNRQMARPKQQPHRYENRLWKAGYAWLSFQYVVDLCDYILTEQIQPEAKIYYPLVTAISVLYARLCFHLSLFLFRWWRWWERRRSSFQKIALPVQFPSLAIGQATPGCALLGNLLDSVSAGAILCIFVVAIEVTNR